MSDSTREVTYHKDGFIVSKDSGIVVQPLDCPVCGYFMLTDSDTHAWHKYSCCHECAITWAEGPNKKKWKSGWRPDKEVIDQEVKRRSKIVPRLKL